jgi:5'-nucleotidase (lipoprotein e(P4) family)
MSCETASISEGLEETWTKAEQAKAVPGAVEFTKYADSKGVKVFYVSNRTADQKEVAKQNLQALGFPMGGNVDTVLMQKDRPEWSSGAKGLRFAYVAQSYRVLLLFGDQFGDFSDKYNRSIAEREKAFKELKAHFRHDWIAMANPGYGSWESAACATISSSRRREAHREDRCADAVAGQAVD